MALACGVLPRMQISPIIWIGIARALRPGHPVVLRRDIIARLGEGEAERRSALSEVEGDILPRPVTCLRSEEHTSELQSLMRISYAVFCLKQKNKTKAIFI